jgi:enoyl-CoA hydratase
MLDLTHRADVLVITLHHGKVNALDLDLLRAVTAAVRGANDEKALVLTGAGRAFSAGVDLRRIIDGGPAYVQEFLAALSETFLAIYDHPGPVVAAVNGHAIAGGCVIAAACDVRLMSQGTIGLAELAVGVPFPTSAIEIMRSAVGPSVGRLALTATLLDASQAFAVGLIDEIVEPESILDAAVQQAIKLRQTPQEVFAFTKRQLHRPTRERITARQAEDDAGVTELWKSHDVQVAIGHYLQRLQQRSRPR